MRKHSDAELADMFAQGEEARANGMGLSHALTKPNGSLRLFWEGGWHKEDKRVAAAWEAYKKTPEYAEWRRRKGIKQRQDMQELRDIVVQLERDLRQTPKGR